LLNLTESAIESLYVVKSTGVYNMLPPHFLALGDAQSLISTHLVLARCKVTMSLGKETSDSLSYCEMDAAEYANLLHFF
jgi:hypothetical protein